MKAKRPKNNFKKNDRVTEGRAAFKTTWNQKYFVRYSHSSFSDISFYILVGNLKKGHVCYQVFHVLSPRPVYYYYTCIYIPRCSIASVQISRYSTSVENLSTHWWIKDAQTKAWCVEKLQRCKTLLLLSLHWELAIGLFLVWVIFGLLKWLVMKCWCTLREDEKVLEWHPEISRGNP